MACFLVCLCAAIAQIIGLMPQINSGYDFSHLHHLLQDRTRSQAKYLMIYSFMASTLSKCAILLTSTDFLTYYYSLKIWLHIQWAAINAYLARIRGLKIPRHSEHECQFIRTHRDLQIDK